MEFRFALLMGEKNFCRKSESKSMFHLPTKSLSVNCLLIMQIFSAKNPIARKAPRVTPMITYLGSARRNENKSLNTHY